MAAFVLCADAMRRTKARRIVPSLSFVQTLRSKETTKWTGHRVLMRRNDGTLRDLFEGKERPFGRITGITFQQQIQFEGFILGIK
jgi:hypothetical protein